MPLSPEQEWTLVACGLIAHADGILEVGEWDQVLELLDERLDGDEATRWLDELADKAAREARLGELVPPAPLFSEPILEKAWRMALADGAGSDVEAAVHDTVALDFARAPRQAEAAIDEWADAHTDGAVQNFSTGMLQRETRVVVTSALVFQAAWQHGFEPAELHDFHISPTEHIEVPMMRLEATAKHSQAHRRGGFDAVELPYVGGAASMIVLVPRLGRLEELEAALTPERLAQLREKMRTGKVVVRLPRFTLASPTLRLQPALTRLGLARTFTPAANFADMTRDGSLYIDDVFTQARVDVDERGTIAAVATAAAANPRGMPPKVFATRPFLFLIVDNDSDAILFMGRVVRPD